MLRQGLLYLSAAAWARGMVTRMGLARRVARRFIAGETIDEAAAATRALNDQGMIVTLDYLGESVASAADTEAVVATYRQLIARIARDQLKASVSVKLTHFGLDLSEELCVNNLRAILTDARSHNIAVTIDMESSAYVDTTLRIYRTLRDHDDFANLGTVIQSYLFRSKDDMQALAAEGATIRLVKGAYLEPATVAFPAKADVDANYAALMRAYLDAPPPALLQIATHDENLIADGEAAARQRNLTPDRFEFQMLYGIRSQRQTELADAGYQVRIYVPFGEAWYPYFMRRLAERPANLWFFARSIFRA